MVSVHVQCSASSVYVNAQNLYFKLMVDTEEKRGEYLEKCYI